MPDCYACLASPTNFGTASFKTGWCLSITLRRGAGVRETSRQRFMFRLRARASEARTLAGATEWADRDGGDGGDSLPELASAEDRCVRCPWSPAAESTPTEPLRPSPPMPGYRQSAPVRLLLSFQVTVGRRTA